MATDKPTFFLLLAAGLSLTWFALGALLPFTVAVSFTVFSLFYKAVHAMEQDKDERKKVLKADEAGQQALEISYDPEGLFPEVDETAASMLIDKKLRARELELEKKQEEEQKEEYEKAREELEAAREARVPTGARWQIRCAPLPGAVKTIDFPSVLEGFRPNTSNRLCPRRDEGPRLCKNSDLQYCSSI